MRTKPDPRFLAITAHDLRGAIGVLDGATKELTRDLPTETADATKLGLMIGRGTQRLLLLADRITILAALMDDRDLDLSEQDLGGIAQQAAERAFSAHARRSVRLRVESTPVLLPVHGPSISGAVSELTALFCGFSQLEVAVRIAFDPATVRLTFESDNASESVRRALRDRSSVAQAGAALAFAEVVANRHHGHLDLPGEDAARAAVSLVLPRAVPLTGP